MNDDSPANGPLLFLERPPRVSIGGYKPSMFLIHGRAAFAKTIFSIEGLLDPRLAVFAIQAPYPSQRGGFEWFHPGEPSPGEVHDADRFKESEDLLTETIGRLIQARSLDTSRIYMLGFSQGAAMTFIVSLRGRIKVRMAIPMSGFLPSPIKSWKMLSNETRFIIPHGDRDEVLPASSSISANEFLISRGIQSEFREYKGRHKMSLSSLREIDEELRADIDRASAISIKV